MNMKYICALFFATAFLMTGCSSDTGTAGSDNAGRYFDNGMNDNGLVMGYDDNAYDNITGIDFSGTETDNSGIMRNGNNANNGNGINNGGMASSSDTGSNY